MSTFCMSSLVSRVKSSSLREMVLIFMAFVAAALLATAAAGGSSFADSDALLKQYSSKILEFGAFSQQKQCKKLEKQGSQKNTIFATLSYTFLRTSRLLEVS